MNLFLKSAPALSGPEKARFLPCLHAVLSDEKILEQGAKVKTPFSYMHRPIKTLSPLTMTSSRTFNLQSNTTQSYNYIVHTPQGSKKSKWLAVYVARILFIKFSIRFIGLLAQLSERNILPSQHKFLYMAGQDPGLSAGDGNGQVMSNLPLKKTEVYFFTQPYYFYA